MSDIPPRAAAPSPLRQFLVTGAMWAGGATVARMPLALVMNAVAARLLLPAEFGVFLLCISVMQIGATIAVAGLPPLLTRALAGSADQRREAVGRVRTSFAITLTIWACLFGLLLWPGRALAVAAGLPRLAAVLPLVSMMVLARALEMLVSESYRGLSDIRSATVFGGFWTHLSTAVVFVALWGAGVAVTVGHAVALYGMLMLVGVLWGLWRLSRRLAAAASEVRRVSATPMLVESAPVLVHTLMFIVLQQADLWIVAALMTANDAALYGAALRVVLLIAVPVNIANQVVPPLVARMHANNEMRQLERIMRSVATLTGAPAALGLVALAAASGPVMAFGFGSFYRDAGPLVVILGVGALASVLAGSCEVALVQTGHQHVMSLASLAGGLVLVVGGVIGASHGSTVMVAVAGAAGVALQNLLMVMWARRLLGLKTYVGLRVGWSALQVALSSRGRSVETPAED